MAKILITGSTGYIGSKLIDKLQYTEHKIRCLTRQPLSSNEKIPINVEYVKGNVFDMKSLKSSMEGIEQTFYLIHSMGEKGDFVELDRKAAINFSKAAREKGIRRIIFLGGLSESNKDLSAHLKSRQEVGQILRSSNVPVIEFRASIIIGSGSLSFEMIRALVERLPVMVTPSWVRLPAQPIAIADVISYLTSALDLPFDENRIFEIGGADTVSYGEIMKEYSKQRKLHRIMLPVPVLTPALSSLWLHLVTPLYARIGRILIESIVHPTIIKDKSALKTFHIKPVGIIRAIKNALKSEEKEFAEKDWSTFAEGTDKLKNLKFFRKGNRYIDPYSIEIDAPSKPLFESALKVLGDQSFYFGNILFLLRELIDLIFGGFGFRKMTSPPEKIKSGDVIRFYRVERITPDKFVRLQVEIKNPGDAWLEISSKDHDNSKKLSFTIIFNPKGLFGILYWYMTYPLHRIAFRGLLKRIEKKTLELDKK